MSFQFKAAALNLVDEENPVDVYSEIVVIIC